jgi:phosphatidylglycerophosphate synthase
VSAAEPFRGQAWRRVPDALTLSRVPLGVAGAWALLDDRAGLAAWFYLIGFLTDVADGLAARSLGITSASGRRLDGAADVAFHVAFGSGMAVRAAMDDAWWVLGSLLALVLGERVIRRWLPAYTVIGKAVAGLYRIVMFGLLLVFTPPVHRTPLIVAGLAVMLVTYTYEGRVTLLELRAGDRTVR